MQKINKEPFEDPHYLILLDKYNELLENYDQLQHDFSENTIIQSMNDMKEQYQTLKKNQKKLLYTLDELHDTNKATSLMIETLITSLKYNTDIDNYALKHKLEFINDIINSNLKKKIDIYMQYYLDET